MSNETPLSKTEFTRYVQLLTKPRQGQDLTQAEGVEYDLLAKRAKIRVPPPQELPKTVIIPIIHETDYVVSAPGVPDAPVV
jgi:hypothetical protein